MPSIFHAAISPRRVIRRRCPVTTSSRSVGRTSKWSRRLRRTAETLAIDVRDFNGMSVQEVADECGLSLAEARLAQLREYGEPFRILASDPAVHSRLLNALRRAGLRCVSGGRFHHVSSGADMRRSVRTLTSLYRQRFGDVLTVGVSSGLA